MRNSILIGIAVAPLLLSFSHAAQNSNIDQPGQNWVFSSEDSGPSSYLGVDIADVTTERLSALKLKEEKGVEVTMVDQDAPAGKAGIKEHDVILTMNGMTIESEAQLRRMIHETPPGRVVTFGLSRDGQPLTVKVQLADKHKEFPGPGNIHVNIPEIHVPDIDIPSINMVMVTSSARSGLMVENITLQLGEFFGVKNGAGVLVRSVEKGSRAEKAGFHAGDVIVKVNGQLVHDTSDFAHGVRSRNADSVSVQVMRDRKEQTLTLSLPARKDSSKLLDIEDAEDELADDESDYDAAEIEKEMAKIRPDIELAVQEAGKAEQEVRESLCQAQKEMKHQSERQRKQFKKQQDEWMKQLEQFRKMQGTPADL
ncbi:MAG TPA: PDZ domain-containing protein [Candidatus Binatia bacterium]|jgi:PDZ domain-containing secreted protein|nr:PDZ domain-containing protein [Candidatus Binatia bacterium]